MVFPKFKITYILTAQILLSFNMACRPYIIAYKHLCIENTPNMQIVKISTVSNDFRGKSLKWPKIGLPLETKLEKHNYIITIYTPLANGPVVWLRVQSTTQKELILIGPNLKKVKIYNPNQDVDYQYEFYADMAKGAPIGFSILTSQGNFLGSESIHYKTVTRGYSIGIERI